MFGSISSDTLAALLLVIVIFRLKRLMGFLNLTKVRMRSSEWAPVLRSRVPEHTLQLLDSAKTGLEGIGFELIGTQANEPLNSFDPRPHKFADFYWHPEKTILAIVDLAEATSGQVTKVQFLTMFVDGKTQMTVNREQWAQLPVPEDILMADAYADDLAGQWKFHQEAMAEELKDHAPVTDRLKVMKRLEDVGLPRWIERMQELGWAKEERPGVYRFTPRGAWRYSGQISKPAAKVRSVLARPYRHAPAPDVRAARMAEMNSVAANIELAAQPFPHWVKAALFALTLVLSVMVFGRDFSPMGAAALLAVLLVHELGHLSAMWAFGYRNLSIFFLPFIGAAATGHKPHASPWQEAIVLLAGPVPGLVLALAATQIPSGALPLPATEFLRSFFWFALVLNLFNLLPIGVMDGGRLFELAVLGRFPFARAAFASLGAAVGLLYALWIGSKILGVGMFLLLIGAPLQFQVAKVISAIRARARATGVKSLGKEEAILALGHEFGSGDYGITGAKGWAFRQNIAKIAYPRLLQGVPGLGVSIGALAIQGLAFFAPLVLIIWAMQQPEQTPLMRQTVAEQREFEKQASEQPEAVEAKAARDEFMSRYDAESDPSAKWAMLERNDDDGSQNFDLEPAWLEQQKSALSDALPADHPGKLRHLLDETDSGNPGAAQTILAVISQLTAGNTLRAADLDEERFALLVDAYGRLAAVATPDVLAGQTAALDALWADLETPDEPKAAYRSQLASARARMAVTAGRPDEAETWMDRYVASAGNRNDYAALTKGWFLLDIGHPDRALALATQAMETAKQKDTPLFIWQTLAGWAEMGLGHPREADAYFQAVMDGGGANHKGAAETLPWWLRLLSWGTGAFSKGQLRPEVQTLDHLAALEGYDPQEAGRVRAALGKKMTPEWKKSFAPNVRSTFDGWGTARKAAHGKILKELESVQ